MENLSRNVCVQVMKKRILRRKMAEECAMNTEDLPKGQLVKNY